MLPVKYFREIKTGEELEDLNQTICEWLDSDTYKKQNKNNKSLPHDDPYLPSFISDDPSRGSIVVVALGDANEQYPELKFGDNTLLGYYAIEYYSPDKEKYHVSWTKHDQKAMAVFVDRIYVPQPFREMKIATQLLHQIEDVFKNHGYGNIEAKPDKFLKEWMTKNGFDTIDGFRYGKIL